MHAIIPTEIRRVYEGRVFTLQIETIPLPKGGALKAEIVRHPGSVVIVPVSTRPRASVTRRQAWFRAASSAWARSIRRRATATS
jgi:hypothetical protein